MNSSDARPLMRHKIVKRLTGVALVLLACSLSACSSVNQYAVNMTPYPVRNVTPAGEQIKGIVLTVANFNDARAENDKNRIGRVIKSDGASVPVIAAHVKPTEAITSGVKSYLKWAGYSVSDTSPAWDLKPETIQKTWGQFVVGGKIDTIEIICQKTNLKVNFRTRVVLSLSLADTAQAAILHTYTVQGESSREDVNLTEAYLRKHLTIEVNNAVTDALEKLLDPKKINAQILKAGGGKKP